MKFIEKSVEPDSVTVWKNLANDDWMPSWSNLQNPEKSDLHSTLIADQKSICCYCEQHINCNNSHIEHFSPRSAGEVDPLEYSNLLASCGPKDEHKQQRHCGDLKGSLDITDLVSPLRRSCERSFTFTADGRIAGIDDSSRYTVEKLGLDVPILKAMRESAIEPFLDPNLTADELDVFVRAYLELDDANVLSPFWTTISQLFGAKKFNSPHPLETAPVEHASISCRLGFWGFLSRTVRLWVV